MNGDIMIRWKSINFDLRVCYTFNERLKGNCGKKEITTVLCFPRCNSIHTFFMRQKIDVIMLDINKKVKYVYKEIKPWKVIWPKKGVYYTIEFPAGENIYQINDYIFF